MARFVNESFLPARVHVKDNPDDFKRYAERYKAPWTPTILELDSDGVEQHRIEGFLPADDFLGQLMLGRARMAFDQQQWPEAERRFHEIVDQLPECDAAAEALYWEGVTRYKASGDPSALHQTGQQFKRRYQQSAWAKKASIWS